MADCRAETPRLTPHPPAAGQVSVWPCGTVRKAHTACHCRSFSPDNGIPSVNTPGRTYSPQVGKATLVPPRLVSGSENSNATKESISF